MMEDHYNEIIEKLKDERLKEIIDPNYKPPFTITVSFGYEESENYSKAVEKASHCALYHERGDGKFKRHYAIYGTSEVEDLFELFNLVKDFKTLDVLICNKRIPYAVELWLFLIWFYRIK
ncbi:MAG: hypothetical protein ACUVUG_02760 [Candidatus Aminicenantia bacterium]